MTLENKIGKPAVHNDANCTLQENGKSLIRLSYDGLDLTIEGTCYNHIRWRGRVLSATLTNSKFRLGSGLKVGNAVSTLYEQYPFISVGSRSATGKMASGEVELKASVIDGAINVLRLTVDNG